MSKFRAGKSSEEADPIMLVWINLIYVGIMMSVLVSQSGFRYWKVCFIRHFL